MKKLDPLPWTLVTLATVAALNPGVAFAADGDLAMRRLYNPNSGEHFYTASAGECDDAVQEVFYMLKLDKPVVFTDLMIGSDPNDTYTTDLVKIARVTRFTVSRRSSGVV